MTNLQKAIVCGLTLVTVGGALAPVSSVFASEVNITTSDKPSDQATNNLKNYGFTDDELALFSSDEKVQMNNQLLSPKYRIGASAVAKAVLKVWKKLPAPVKSAIGKYAGIEGLIKAIDHFTGTEYHIIYSACRYVGMPAGVADFVTKTITLFI